MKKKHPLSEEDKTKIISLHLQNKSNLEIRQIMGVVSSTVQRHISDYYKQLSDKGEEYFDIHKLDCWVSPSTKK
jgi:DNA-directed RNA polymerase specialized sigma subunit